MSSQILPFTASTYIVNAPQKVGGMKYGARSTIVVLPSGGLVIISPIAFSDEQAAQIEELGQVDFIVAPNLFHYLYFNDACRRWPNARALVPRSLARKTELVEHAESMAPTGAIEDVLFWHQINGVPKVQEHVFALPQDELLIITDLAFHFRNHPQLWLRMMMSLVFASYGRLAPSRLFKSVIEDKKAFGQSLRSLLDYPFDALIMAHGEPIKEGARRALEDAFAAYLKGKGV